MKDKFFVYEFWTAEECVYVGYTANLPSRLRDHIGQSSFGVGVTDIQITVYPTKHDALDAERGRILELQPLYNSISKNQRRVGMSS